MENLQHTHMHAHGVTSHLVHDNCIDIVVFIHFVVESLCQPKNTPCHTTVTQSHMPFILYNHLLHVPLSFENKLDGFHYLENTQP